MKRVKEADLYPIVDRWMCREWGCFASKTNTGTRLGRIDVAGVRDIGGDLSGEAEVIAIEVKAGTQVFTTAAGQAFGYSVYANRVYLADYRPAGVGYTADEVAIAGRLGVGLLLIRPNNRIIVVQTSPLHQPIEALRSRTLHSMGLATCSLCNGIFQRSDEGTKEHVVRDGRRAVRRAVEAEKGLVWWLHEAGNRDGKNRAYTYARRYLCPDCTGSLFRDLVDTDT